MAQPSGVDGCAVCQVIQVTVVNCEWRACGETHGSMVKGVKFAGSGLRGRPIDVTIIKYGKDF